MTFDARLDSAAILFDHSAGDVGGAMPAPPAPPAQPSPEPGVGNLVTTRGTRSSAPPSALFDELPDAVLRFDRALVVIYVNSAAVQSFGVSRAELVGHRLIEVEPMQEFAPLWDGKLAAAFDTLEGRTFNFIYPYPTGAKNFEVRLYVEPDGYGEAGHVTAFARDITVPRSAMRANRAADSLVSTLMSSARIGMAVLDRNLRYLRCNAYMTQMLGVEQRDLLGRRLDEAFDLSGQPDVMRSLIRMRDNELRSSHQVEYQFSGGDLSWVRERRTPLLNARGEFNGVFLTVERLDRERFAETSLAALRQALERAGEMVLEIRRDGSIVDANETALSWLGYSRDQITGMRLDAIDANLGSARFAEVLERLHARGSYHGETQYRTRAGTEFAVDVVLQRVEHGEREFIFLLVRDISDRKRFESVLAENNNRLSSIFNESPVGFLLLDAEFRITRANRSACALLGRSEAELFGQDPSRLFHAEDAEASLRERTAVARDGGQGASVTEPARRLTDPAGQTRWVNLVWRSMGGAQGPRESLLVLENFTDRKHYEERLQRLLAESRLIFDTALVGLLFVRDGNILRANAAMEDLLGCEPGMLVGQIQLFAHPTDRLLLAALDERIPEIRDRGACQFELYMCRRSGDPIWVAVQGRAVNPERPDLGYIFAFVDIDQRKRSERELRNALNELQLIFDNALVAIIYVADDLIVKANAAGERLFGFPPADLGEVQFGSLFVDPAAWTRLLSQVSAATPVDGHGGRASFELPMRRADGSVFWCAGNAGPIESGAPERGMIVALTDVDARHRSEEELRRVRNHLDLVIESLPVLVSVRDAATGRFVSMNRAGEALTGLSRQQVLGRSWHEIYGRQFADLYAELDRRAVAEGCRIDRPRDVMLRADGRALTVNQRVVPIFDDRADAQMEAGREGREHATAKYVMSIIDDLTGEVQTETALRETETRFRQFAENIDQVVFIADADLTRVHYINDRYARLVGGAVADLLADPRSAMAFVHPDDRRSIDQQLPRLLADLRRLRRGEISVRIAHPERGTRWLNVRLNPARVHDGSVRVFGIADDVTERRAAEQQRLDEAVQQRDVLVREVHHRIKNNLQGVAGLLQQMASAKPEVSSALNEIAGQIQAIAQVHGLQIGIGGTLPVLGMAQGIFSNLGAMFGVEVRFESDSPELWRWGLPENEAVPIALVINELGTNAIKYRAARELPIQVRIDGTADGLVITIDNAGRLPPGFDFARVVSGVSGLSLIKALLPRRGARLRIEAIGPVVRASLDLAPPAIREEAE